jgi:lysozyme family protein
MSFDAALRRVLGAEGEYSNDPADTGGETFCGISRRHWPNWPGWKSVDAQKPMRPTLRMPGMHEAVGRFYVDNFWTPLGCHLMTDEWVAYEVFEAAVNVGTVRSGQFLQESLNLLNRNGKSWPELVLDGRIGPTTLATLAKAQLETRGGERVVILMNRLQAEHYIALARRSATQEVFLRGWLDRTVESR